jgi:flavin-dependent dehydrogenase
MRKTDSIVIVGGGTAGLVSALILKTKFPSKKIDVIASKQIGIIGVGEGSTEHWREFMSYVGIDQYEMLEQTDGTLKLGIMFTNWAEKPYFHSVQIPYDFRQSQYNALYAKIIGDGKDSSAMSSPLIWNSLVDENMDNDKNKFIANQFHFNTNKLNEYLQKNAKIRGINVIDDIITDVILDDDGYVKSLTGENSSYEYDFYIDSTGFKRLLINKLGAEWQSHSKYLKMKSAIVFQLPEEEVMPMWTLAHAMDYGWLFRIPVYDRFGNGYIFDSDYINADQAKAEVEKYFGKEITVGKQINFDPGALKDVWIKNCVAVGLSASFIEPLEASSIGTSIQQTLLLTHRLENYTEPVVDSYNKSCTDILENIRDFVILHYLTRKDNTQFWKDVSDIELPESLQSKLNLWKHKLPVAEDFSGLSHYVLFKDVNFLFVLHGLGLFDTDSIKKEYDAITDFVQYRVNDILSSSENFARTARAIPHKEYIRRIHQRQKILRGEL